MLKITKDSGDFTKEELRTAEDMQRRDNRSSNFRWIVASSTILIIGICWIRNKYGKTPLIKIHQTEKKEKTAKKKEKEGEKK